MKNASTNDSLPGLHHVTAITGDAQRNLDFYTGTLGLRLIKVTVNFDDPGAYHLYYGDRLGNPGTVMTFFAWPGVAPGRSGAGQTTATAFAIPRASLDFWRARLAAEGVAFTEPAARFGDAVLSFTDPDGLTLELIAADDARPAWEAAGGTVPAAHNIRGFHGVTLTLRDRAATADLLSGPLGFLRVGEINEPGIEAPRVRYAASDAPGAFVDILTRPEVPPGQTAVGTVHHIAWRTPDDAAQLAWLGQLDTQGYQVTPVQDRSYFHSIYFRTPGGVLFEIATDTPGFTTDETPESLGTALKLPPQYEAYRAQLVQALPPLRLPDTK